jgi:hypothetical protein
MDTNLYFPESYFQINWFCKTTYVLRKRKLRMVARGSNQDFFFREPGEYPKYFLNSVMNALMPL